MERACRRGPRRRGRPRYAPAALRKPRPSCPAHSLYVTYPTRRPPPWGDQAMPFPLGSSTGGGMPPLLGLHMPAGAFRSVGPAAASHRETCGEMLGAPTSQLSVAFSPSGAQTNFLFGESLSPEQQQQASLQMHLFFDVIFFFSNASRARARPSSRGCFLCWGLSLSCASCCSKDKIVECTLQAWSTATERLNDRTTACVRDIRPCDPCIHGTSFPRPVPLWAAPRCEEAASRGCGWSPKTPPSRQWDCSLRSSLSSPASAWLPEQHVAAFSASAIAPGSAVPT